ncbi:MAG: site-2 protease family protein [Acidimicrobiales bacterium]
MSSAWTPQGPSGRRPPDQRRTVTIAVIVAVAVVAVLVRTHHIQRFWVIYFCVLIPSIILHEVSHGFVANLFGDDTAKRAGRLTLNPVAHVDLFGSIIVPALLVLTSSVAFGWAKPVPVNVSRLRHARNTSVLVSLAGPATNAVLFVGAGLVYRALLAHQSPLTLSGPMPLGFQILLTVGLANLTVGMFNLIPIPPLDGSAVIERLVPTQHLQRYYRIRPFGLVLVFLFAILVLDNTGVGSHLFSGELRLWNGVAGPSPWT